VLAASQEFDRLLILGERRAAWDTINAALARMGPHGVLASDVDSLLAMCAEPGEVTAVLDRAVASGFARPLDSEWLIAMAYFADAAVRTRHETAAALLHEKLAPYAGLVVIDGIGAACWSSVDALLASLAPIADREDAGPPEATRVEPLDAEFRREGDIWSLCYADRRVQTTDTKGMRDLATLLSLPGRPVHVSDLVADAVDRGSGGEKSDRRAISAYRDRLAELERALDDADARNDAARSERLAAERDALVAELASVAGLGDRPRRVDDPVERMRKTVRYRVKAAIDRIERVHPELGRHLAVSVHTGTVCSYDPERPVHWRF
jgi:hypothetical protein